MNLFLHGQEDFDIVRGDTLREPKFLQSDRLETFDCVVANPPFSLKEWGYDLWSNDPYGRKQYGLAPKTNGDFPGCSICLPHLTTMGVWLSYCLMVCCFVADLRG